MFKKTLSLILAISLMFSLTFFSNAKNDNTYALSRNETGVQPFYTYTNDYTTIINISNGSVCCTADVTGYSSTTKITITMTLQKKTLFWWSDIETWTTTVYNFTALLSGTVYNVDSGTYRTKAVYTVYSGNDSETITGYSQETKYQS